MSGKESILGPQNKRVKTDIRLSPSLTKQVTVFCKHVGIPKNVFFTVSACNLLLKWGPLINTKKQKLLYEIVNDLVQKIHKKSS